MVPFYPIVVQIFEIKIVYFRQKQYTQNTISDLEQTWFEEVIPESHKRRWFQESNTNYVGKFRLKKAASSFQMTASQSSSHENRDIERA